jgi:hypothetical protein
VLSVMTVIPGIRSARNEPHCTHSASEGFIPPTHLRVPAHRHFGQVGGGEHHLPQTRGWRRAHCIVCALFIIASQLRGHLDRQPRRA